MPGAAAADDYALATWLFLRALGLVYLVAFASFAVQARGLVGEGGILPAGRLLEQVRRSHGRRAVLALPTLCWWRSDDRFLGLLCGAGVVLSLLLIVGFAQVPALVGLVVLLVSVQLLLRRDHIWLPRWMLKRSVSRDKLCKGLGWLRRPARFVDRLLRPRLTALTRGPAVYVIGATCILVAAATPAMEFVPFSATIAGAVLTAFGLALIARDGALAVTAFVLTAGGLGWVGYELLTK